MKKIFKTKFTFGKFLIGLLVLFGLVAAFKVGQFFWDHRDMSEQKITILTQSTYTSEGLGNLYITLQEIAKQEPIEKAEVKVWLEDTNEKKIADLSRGGVVDGRLNIGFQLNRGWQNSLAVRTKTKLFPNFP